MNNDRSSLVEFKARLDTWRLERLQMALRTFKNARVAFQENPTEETAKKYVNSIEVVWSIKAEFRIGTNAKTLAVMQGQVGNCYVDFACTIARVRRRQYATALRLNDGGKIGRCERGLMDPPTCMTEDEIKSLRDKIRRERLFF